jgi:nicotinamidase/pyrazinamidase
MPYNKQIQNANTDFVYLFKHNLALLNKLQHQCPPHFVHLHTMAHELVTLATEVLCAYQDAHPTELKIYLQDGLMPIPKITSTNSVELNALLQTYHKISIMLQALHSTAQVITAYDSVAAEVGLLVVDLQNDFISGAHLAIPNARTIVAPINDLICKTNVVAYSRDMHSAEPTLALWTQQHILDANHNLISLDIGSAYPAEFMLTAGNEFCGGTYWGEHCVRNTPGSNYDANLILKHDAVHVHKGCGSEHHYGAVHGVVSGSLGLIEYYRKHNITTIIVTGLATEYCVKESAAQLLNAGFNVIIPLNTCRGLQQDANDVHALQELKAQYNNKLEIIAEIKYEYADCV